MDALGCRGAVCVDYVASSAGPVYALGVNTTPGLSWGSNFAVAAEFCGLDLAVVVHVVLHEALSR
ncbi:hypothetical protein [Nocardia miyunensis]|uniref:hypothetical protein n=1 Tax=Nocardia miyunensis TaxID=282684 RepID=UPI000B168A4E|nr:hypothetical protein [Nocardia miyunensis]